MNTVQLIGRLTRDPEMRFTNGGTATCTGPSSPHPKEDATPRRLAEVPVPFARAADNR